MIPSEIGDDRRERDLNGRVRPDAGDVQERHEADEEDDPDVDRDEVPPEDVMDDRGGDERLRRRREEHDRHVAHEDGERGEEDAHARAHVLVHRAGARDHRGELGEAHRLQVHREKGNREREEPDPAEGEAGRDRVENGRGDDQAEGRPDRRGQADRPSFEADLPRPDCLPL